MDGEWLSSGEMSRASGLSAKALRLYHANGLLVPARVDEATGYRGYAAARCEPSGAFDDVSNFLYHVHRGMLEFVGYTVLEPVGTYGPRA